MNLIFMSATSSGGFLMDLFIEMIGNVITSWLAYFGFIINDIFAVTLEINQTREVIALTSLSSIVSISLLTILIGKQLIGTYGLESEGDPERNPINILYKAAKCVAVIGCNGWIFTELLKITTALSNDINQVINQNTSVSDYMQYLLQDSEIKGPAYMMCLLAIAVGILLFLLSAGRRAAELSISRIILPIFAVDILSPNPEKWNMFFFQYVINFVGFNIQMICFRLMIIFMSQLNTPDIQDFVKKFILVMGWLTMSIKVPQWLEKYMYVSGTGRTVSNGASRLSQVLMYTGMKR